MICYSKKKISLGSFFKLGHICYYIFFGQTELTRCYSIQIDLMYQWL